MEAKHLKYCVVFILGANSTVGVSRPAYSLKFQYISGAVQSVRMT